MAQMMEREIESNDCFSTEEMIACSYTDGNDPAEGDSDVVGER